MHDPEERLVSPPVRLLAPPRPSRGPPQRLLMVFATRIGRRTLVEDHHHVRAEVLLNPRRQLGGGHERRAVVYGRELHPLFRDTPRLGQREDLVAARVCEDRAFPAHEGVKPPGLPQIFGGESLDGSLRPYRHEGWRLYPSARCTQDAGARFTVTRVHLYGDGGAYRCRPPSRRSIASPKE